MTEEEKNEMNLSNVESVPNVEGIIRYDVPTMLALRDLMYEGPELFEAECVVSKSSYEELLKEHEEQVNEKEKVAPVISEFPVEAPRSVRVDVRVRSLRNIMNQFTLDNPEVIGDMLLNNVEEYVEEESVLRSGIESMIDKCCVDSMYCDAFVALLKLVIGRMSDKHSLMFRSALLDCSEARYKSAGPDVEKGSEEEAMYEERREGFFHFLGALFVNSLVCEDIILTVMIELSKGYPEAHHDIRCLLQMVRTIGSCMEHDAGNKLTIDEIFRTLTLWQQEHVLPENLLETIRGLRDLKDAKWVITMEVDKSMESIISTEWEKSTTGRHARNKKEVDEEEAETIRETTKLILYCKNLWTDYVRNFVMEDIVDEVVKFDGEQRCVFVHCSMKSLVNHSEVEQRRVSMLLEKMVADECISREMLRKGMENILADYAKLHKTNKHTLRSFRNMYFPLFTDGYLTLRDVVEMWKNKDHFDGVLSELIFNLARSWKNIDEGEGVKALEEAKLSLDDVFVGGCPRMVADRILEKNEFVEKNGVICFAF